MHPNLSLPSVTREPVTVVWGFFFAYLLGAWLLMSYVKHYKR
jgi:hypothetical protein